MQSSTSSTAPGAILCEAGTLQLNRDRAQVEVTVSNAGSRPIQVGSHYHFFEVNRALKFNRAETYGFRLDIPAGTAVRFEPGDTKAVTLVAIGGDRFVRGLNNLVNGALDDPAVKAKALEQLQAFVGEA